MALPEITALDQTRSAYHDLIMAQLHANQESADKAHSRVDEVIHDMNVFRSDHETRITILETSHKEKKESHESWIVTKHWMITTWIAILALIASLLTATAFHLHFH